MKKVNTILPSVLEKDPGIIWGTTNLDEKSF